jgi:hypothetical protein
VNRHRWRWRALLALLTTALALLLVEATVRLLTWAGEARRRAAWQELAAMPPLPPGEEARLANLIRPCRNPRRVYELIPGLDVRFMGQTVRTDAAGCRGPRSDVVPDGVQIVGLGDSVMFGWGVAEEDCFLRRLESLLRERHAQVRWQAVNTAVPGYNTVMEVETLKDVGLARRPALVILDLVGNDMDLPNFIEHRNDYLGLSTSFLLEWVASVFRGRDTQAFRPLALAPKRDAGHYLGDPERVPPQYRDMVGPLPFRRALEELRELARRHSFALLVTSHLHFDPSVRELLAELGLAAAETGDAVERYRREHGIATYQGSVLTVSADDPHPSPIVHRLQAEAIYDRLAATGLLEQLLQPR